MLLSILSSFSYTDTKQPLNLSSDSGYYWISPNLILTKHPS